MKRALSMLMIFLFIYQVTAVNLIAQSTVNAQITNVSGSRITIDQGAAAGLTAGVEGVVYYTEQVGGREVAVAVALVKVVSVSPGSAQLEIFDSTARVQEGYLVQLSVVPGPKAPQTKKGGSKWWIWVLVAAAGGGLAAAAGGGGGGGGGGTTTPTTGVISIDLPAN